MKANGELIRVADLSVERRENMFQLMEAYYENVDRATFDTDLDEKDWVIQLVEEASGQLVGFSTQVLMELLVQERPIRALFSGDTIIDGNWRGQQQLFHISGWLVRHLMHVYQDDELYWFLISKGYKTYRFLPLFFNEFYPSYLRTTPPNLAMVIDGLGTCLSATRYDRRAGVLRGGPNACRLKPGVADISPGRLRDPHIRYFVQANPGHADGDELCCITPLAPSNFTPAAYRAMGPVPPAELQLL